MKLFRAIAHWYKLRRHRLGMGVHSPFAYRMVRDVIYGNGLYYSFYGQYRLTKGFPKRMSRVYRVLFRLIARLAPEGVRIAGSVEPQMETLVRLADTRPVLGRGLGGYDKHSRVLTICEATDLCSADDLPRNILKDGNMLVVRELRQAPAVLARIKETMKGGWLFTDKYMAIAVSDDRQQMCVTETKMV